MAIDYNNRRFKVATNSENGEVSSNLIFHYLQKGNMLSCTYADKKILHGHLIGIVKEDGTIDLSYHQINDKHELKTGLCNSRPEMMPNGKIRIHENWRWTSGDLSEGTSMLEEV
jgi:hypothetical protein